MLHGILALILAACAPPAPAPEAHAAEVRSWHEGRLTRLKSETGWLTLAGLYWLREGPNRMGSAPDNDLVLPAGKAPARVGVLVLAEGKVRLEVAPDAQVTRAGQPFASGPLRSDAEGDPDLLEIGSLNFLVIRRGDKVGIRLRDRESEARRDFKGIDTWPVSPAWRLEARFEPYDPPRQIGIPTVLGTVENMTCPGVVIFQAAGREFRLEPVLEEGTDDLFFIFADETNGKESYGAGRFLYTEPPEQGRVVIDFNRSYNPPCAFTPYATCPLPPRQNRLALRVDAGEKAYGHH